MTRLNMAVAPSAEPAVAETTTVIGRDTCLRGDIKVAGDALILGTLTGNLEVGGALEIGEDASVTGDVRCDSILLAGTIQGDLHSTNQAKLLPSASLHGNLVAASFAVDQGAMYTGNVIIGMAQGDSGRPSIATVPLCAAPRMTEPKSTANCDAITPPPLPAFGSSSIVESATAAAAQVTEESQVPEIKSRTSVVNGLIRRRTSQAARSVSNATS